MKKIFFTLVFVILVIPLVFSQQQTSVTGEDSIQKSSISSQQYSKENLVKKIRIGNAYPNPAIYNTQIEYSLPAETTSSKIIIRNLLGDVVIEQNIKDLQGKVNISVSELEGGVYFYSLIFNGTTITTRKLIINK